MKQELLNRRKWESYPRVRKYLAVVPGDLNSTYTRDIGKWLVIAPLIGILSGAVILGEVLLILQVIWARLLPWYYAHHWLMIPGVSAGFGAAGLIMRYLTPDPDLHSTDRIRSYHEHHGDMMSSLNLYQMSRSVRKAAAFALAAGLVIGAIGCRKAASSVPPLVPEVVVATVIQRDVPVYSEWIGTTEGFVNAKIYPKISGYVLKQIYKDGEQVRAGQLLFQIDAREYQAALDQALGQLAQQQAQNKKNQQDLARYKPLYAQRVVSAEEYDHINQAAYASKAAVQAAQAAVETARLNVEWTQVMSPINGIAGIAKAQVGDLVGTTSLLTTVSQLDPIKVTFPISEREYLHFAGKIREHEETGRAKDESDLQMILADGSTYKYRGHFYVANRQVDVQTGTIKIQGIFPNPDSILRPGLYAKIRTAADTNHGALLIPQSAVLETQGQYQVAVVGADNKVTLRPVALGKLAGKLRIIDSGVSPGERVVTEGVQKVSDGMEVAPKLEAPASGGATPSSSAATPAPQT